VSVDYEALLKASGIAALNELTPIAELSKAANALPSLARDLSQVDRMCLISAAAQHLKANKVEGGSKSLLEAAFKSESRGRENDSQQGRPVAFSEPEPWDEAVDGDQLLRDLVTTVERFVGMSSHAAIAVALWVVHTHAFDAAQHTPRLAIVSPTKRCGKTTLLTLLRALSAKPMFVSNVSAAALFRTIESACPTLLVDEADSFMDDKNELRGVINAGHERSGGVMRCDPVTLEPRQFSAWAPMAIATIGKLPGTIMDRSIVIEMRRLPTGERKAKLRRRVVRGLQEDLPRKCARWVADHSDSLRYARTEVPDELNDRAADHWEPLIAIADYAGGEWPTRAREGALRLQASVDADTDVNDRGSQLLADIHDLIAQDRFDRINMRSLCARLVAMDDRPWGDQKGKPLTTSALGRMLRTFGIDAKPQRSGADVAKGYDASQFSEAFARYLPAKPVTPVTPAESLENGPIGDRLRKRPNVGAQLHESPDKQGSFSLL
jgi:putative DNA primase/helicase